MHGFFSSKGGAGGGRGSRARLEMFGGTNIYVVRGVFSCMVALIGGLRVRVNGLMGERPTWGQVGWGVFYVYHAGFCTAAAPGSLVLGCVSLSYCHFAACQAKCSVSIQELAACVRPQGIRTKSPTFLLGNFGFEAAPKRGLNKREGRYISRLFFFFWRNSPGVNDQVSG